MTYGTVNVDSVVNSDGTITGGLYGFKNRIINGAMVIDQRNAGASVTATDTTQAVYTVDRWAYRVLAASKLSFQQSSTAPAGFKNSMLVTSLSAYSIASNEFLNFRQPIEGLNVSDLGWGTANAQSVTLSFWVRSSLTGTFGGYLDNVSDTRFYPFSYTINSANTWEQKTITIAGDTTGTWLTTNGVGILLGFCLGAGSTYTGTAGSWTSSAIIAPTGTTNLAGTNGATWYITGVQFEKGSTATSFDYRPYGTELALCQRYYQVIGQSSAYTTFPSTSNNTALIAMGVTTNYALATSNFPVTMRASPTVTFANNGGTLATLLNYNVGNATVSSYGVSAWNLSSISFSSGSVTASSLIQGQYQAVAEL